MINNLNTDFKYNEEQKLAANAWEKSIEISCQFLDVILSFSSYGRVKIDVLNPLIGFKQNQILHQKVKTPILTLK